jgi:RNA polymerase primary sigma factor
MHTDYRVAAMRELRDQQVRFAPREKKLEQVGAAEKLLTEIEPDRIYTYEYLRYRITGFRPDEHLDVTFDGRDATHDLGLFIDDLSGAARVAADSVGEPVVTIEDLAKRFNVSTKTIARWRRLGLISRRFVMDGRKRVGFLESSVDRFVAENSEKVRRGSEFRQLTAAERSKIIERARRLSQAGGLQTEIIRRIAKKFGRSSETVRYTLRHFDRKHGDLAVFPDGLGPLRAEARQKIFHQFHRGETAESLAKRFGRTRSGIYRIVSEIRAEQIAEMPLDFIHNDSFAKAVGSVECEQEILAEMPPNDEPVKKVRIPSGLPPYLASLYDVPLLNRNQESHLFRKMNYLKYKACKLREGLSAFQPRASTMDQIGKLYEEAVATKNQIIRANLRLVVSIAKRHVGPVENFFELVSDGNVSLMRAVEKFDYARGYKFSTYASWAIMKNFARTIPDEHRYHDRFRSSNGEIFTSSEDDRGDQIEQESSQSQRQWLVEKILGRLDPREQKVIIRRFGLQRGQESLTLKEVGAELGVSKERIRQLEARALSKLRQAVEEEKMDFPG